MRYADNVRCDVQNIYTLDGRVPLLKAIPFGLQHVLAMFVANLVPITIVASSAKLPAETVAFLVQNAMFIAGIASLIQLYPLFKIGAKLPIIMGVSFTFVTALSGVAAQYGYAAVVGAVLVGGVFEGTLGLFAKYWRKLISPVVSACVVIAIGISLLPVGARSFGGGYTDQFGSIQNLIIGTVTLLSCLLFQIFARSFYKQLSVLFGLVVGYALASILGAVNVTHLFDGSIVSLPHFFPFTPEFHIGPIISVAIIFLVSATETIGDTTAMVSMGLNRSIRDQEIAGSIACDGYTSAISGLFGCMPVTSFSQNVGLIAMTKVVNRFTIMTGAVAMVLAGLFPPIGRFFASLPEPVLGGCTIIMFGTILTSGIQMLLACPFCQKTVMTVSLSLSIGLGFTMAPEIFTHFPPIIKDIFAENNVATVFIVAVLLDWLLPANMEIQNPSSAPTS